MPRVSPSAPPPAIDPRYVPLVEAALFTLNHRGALAESFARLRQALEQVTGRGVEEIATLLAQGTPPTGVEEEARHDDAGS